MALFHWLDITKPSLKAAFAAWAGYRHDRTMPPVTNLNQVVEAGPKERGMTLLAPQGFGSAKVRAIGALATDAFPDCRVGVAIDSLLNPFERGALVSPLRWVFHHASADCRRLLRPLRQGGALAEMDAGRAVAGQDTLKMIARGVHFEVLLLPFDDGRGQIRAVQVFVDTLGALSS